MKKILVSTDFSNASKAGMRFAIQLATQMDLKPVFFHCFQALIPTAVQHERIEHALQKQGDDALQKLERFVAKVHRAMKVNAGIYKCAVVESLNPDKAITDYARDHDFQFICMSTHGAGTMRRIIGTHTGNVLKNATLPVIVVPHTYRVKPLKKVLYASDLESFDKEMAVVNAFAGSLNVKADLAHFFYPGEITLDPDNLSNMWKMKYPTLDHVYLEQYNIDKGFSAQLDHLSSKVKPSLVVFFKHSKHTWFDKFFSVSISKTVSFVTKVPMLVYQK